MDEVLELLASIPEKCVEPGKAQNRLKQLVKSLQRENRHYGQETCNKLPNCVKILCCTTDKNNAESKALLCSDESSQITDAVFTLKNLLVKKQYSLSAFLSAVLKNNVPLPLELLVLLQTSDIMQLTTYLSKYIEKYEATAWFIDSIAWLVKDDSSKHCQIITEVLSTLLAVREPGSLTCAQDLSVLSSTLIDQFCLQITEWVLGLPENEVSPNNLNYLSELDCSEQLSKSAIRSFAYAHLIKLTSTNNTNHILPMCNVPSFQNKKWKLSLAPPSLKSLFLEVVSVLGPDEVLRCILSCLGKSEINWRSILLLTSSILHAKGGSEKMMGFIDQLLRRGLECDSQLDLGASLLFARQCCQEATLEFGTYSHWFGAHFGVGTASARSPDQYRSLLQILVDFVPAEPPAMLRVHLNAVPKAPTSCHSLLRDYTELARARLDELNEPAEMEGLFMNSYDGEHDTRAQDVGRVLQHFIKSEKVLKVVLEAAVFRRKYYENVFLVELLQLPGWSQQHLTPEEAGVRHEFIQKLKSMDKIPLKLYTAYKSIVEDTRSKEGGKSEPQTMKHQLSPMDSAQKNKGKLQIKRKR